MKVKIDHKIQKQILKLRDESLKNAFLDFIEELIEAENILNIAGIKKLSGHTDFFRYRIGSHRVGFMKIDDEILIEKFKHRKEFYRKYP